MSRIIAGRAKGKRLVTPKGDRTRPTTDRTREALFSALVSWFGTTDQPSESQLDGVAVLDLFAGSGAVGLEAASRGAGPVVLVEADRPTSQVIRANADATALRVDIRQGKAESVVETLGRRFDVVFLDPPYDYATDAVEALLGVLGEQGMAERGLVVVERSGRDKAPQFPPVFTDTWDKKYGETTLFFGATE